jgi:3-oxoadipate enol-lactonase
LIDTVLGSVRVQVRGSGEAMMFWPSLLMTGDMWAGQADHFGTDHRVILVDPPGFGESQKLTAPFTFEDCARCIVDILDGLGVQRTHFVGNSWAA